MCLESAMVEIRVDIVNWSGGLSTRDAFGALKAVWSSKLDKLPNRSKSESKSWCVSCSRSDGESNAIDELVDPEERDVETHQQDR